MFISPTTVRFRGDGQFVEVKVNGNTDTQLIKQVNLMRNELHHRAQSQDVDLGF